MKFVLLALSALFVFSCAKVQEDKIVPSEIYTGYDVNYYESDQLLVVGARFQVGRGAVGTQVKLSYRSSIQFDGENMREWEDVLGQVGYTYKAQMAPTVAASSVFQIQYSDPDRKTYLNTVQLPGKISFVAPAIASRNSAMNISWSTSSAAVDFNDSVNFNLASSTGQIESINLAGNFGNAGSFVFSAAQMLTMAGPTASLSVCRYKQQPANAPAVGGSLSIKYCSVPQLITIN